MCLRALGGRAENGQEGGNRGEAGAAAVVRGG